MLSKQYFIAYGKGYQDGQEDLKKRVAALLWKTTDLLDDLDPELTKMLDMVVRDIEKLK